VEDFRQGAAAIAAALPQVSVVRFEATHYRAAFEKLEVLASRSNREAAFLVEAVPLILQQVSTSGVRRVEDRIMAIARDCGVLACSLVVIAALSCLYEDASSQAILVGRKLIKPAARYRSSDAYNAVADLKHLELLAMAQALNEIPPTSLCTRDAGLALFWTALSPQWAGESGLDPQCEVMLDPRLFPRLDEEGLRQLSTQLAGAR
jgi:hypothetical protein